MTNGFQKATLLVNRAARGVSPRFDEQRVAAYLRRRGVDTRVECPESASAAREAAARAGERGDDALFVVGGDGSVREAATGLAGSGTALAAVPMGTVNIWARETGVPTGLRAALDAHLGGRMARVDLGRAGEHRFLLMASLGWDAAIARDVSRSLKRRIGDLAYIARAAVALPRLRPTPARWHAGGTTYEDRLAVMVLSNTRLYGGRVYFNPVAYADDGLLDIAALCPHSMLDGAWLSVKLLAGRLATDRRVTMLQSSELFMETPGLPVQVDGDYVDRTPMRFSIEPGALCVSVPAGPLPAILSGEGVLTPESSA